MDPNEKPKREIIVNAGRFRSQTVFTPVDWLHPADIPEAVESLRDIGAGLPPLTICTRNPYVLDAFPADKCFVVGPKGKTKCLLEHPKAKELLGSLSTGEFWSTVGEEWVDQEEV
jgi:hypothetical protein